MKSAQKPNPNKSVNTSINKKEDLIDDNVERQEILKKINLSRDLTGTKHNADKLKRKERPLVINVAYTQYEILKEVGQETGFVLNNDEEGEDDWDVWWIDGPIFI